MDFSKGKPKFGKNKTKLGNEFREGIDELSDDENPDRKKEEGKK